MLLAIYQSGDNGSTWQEVLVIDPDGPGRSQGHMILRIWMIPMETLVFWAQAAAIGNWCNWF